MAKKVGLDKFKTIADTQNETEVNLVTRETMNLVQKDLNKGKEVEVEKTRDAE